MKLSTLPANEQVRLLCALTPLQKDNMLLYLSGYAPVAVDMAYERTVEGVLGKPGPTGDFSKFAAQRHPDPCGELCTCPACLAR